MKNFALKYPFAASLIVFLTIFIGGTIASIILGVLMIGDCKPTSPSDPCDGGAMAAAAIWYVGFMGSLIMSVLTSISTFVILILKIKRKEEQGYK
jgi:hypothetical protein